MEKIRKEFPVLRKGIYVDTATYGPLYDSLMNWRQGHDLDFLVHASDMRERSLKLISDTRSTVGDFFKCKWQNVSLINNFSTGLNVLLGGMDKKKKVLLLENDYPSVNWSFENRDFKISYTKAANNLEERLKEIIAKDHINVLALSLVQWVDGFMVDLGFLKNLKKEHPDLIIIADGTQFCGTRTFDFETSGIDVLGASGYKWLLAGYGNGFMLFSDQAKDTFSLNSIGFNAADGNFDQKNDIRFAKKFEPGHLSCLNFGSLKFSLEYMKSIGVERISDHSLKISQLAKETFSEMGLLKETIMRRKGHSTIFNIKGNDRIFQLLRNNNVHCAQRGEGIRLGFHFYNEESDLNEIVRILKTAL
ncbi:aminotransferase class V-fold PLP-dependent enzyme [Maribacter sp. 2304DJ31-5]|uniref:aminotransferase class V-fold PLP-dependent enzyme n=1 Tax=Maribacter sp. 2304DJ31-5 TaxID=3386273 RepID=UPI0039BC74D2